MILHARDCQWTRGPSPRRRSSCAANSKRALSAGSERDTRSFNGPSRRYSRALGVRRLDLGPQGGSVLFEERSGVDPATLVRLIQKGAREYRLEGPLKLRVSRALPAESARFEFAAQLLRRLGEPARIH